MNDTQLQLALAKMLPEKIETWSQGDTDLVYPAWKRKQGGQSILDTEWLHVCWLVEQAVIRSLDADRNYLHELSAICPPENTIFTPARAIACASWQQRAEALCKVKGITYCGEALEPWTQTLMEKHNL